MDWAVLAGALATAGCARLPYRWGAAEQYHAAPELIAATTQPIERGARRPVIDGFGWVWGIPDKIILWDRRIDNHDISPQTERAIADYLDLNELWAVKVRLNQYAPRDEWRRLVANKSVGWGWRYSVGVFSWAGDTIFPGRLFGGDHYNPFTNTVYIYSDVPAVALHEAGHAKDFARRRWPGTYAALYALPIVPLYHEAVATRDAMDYLAATENHEGLKEGYRLLYPAYGTYVGGATGDWLLAPYGLVAYAGGVVGGHAAGRWRAYQTPDGTLMARDGLARYEEELADEAIIRLLELESLEQQAGERELADDLEPFDGSVVPTAFIIEADDATDAGSTTVFPSESAASR